MPNRFFSQPMNPPAGRRDGNRRRRSFDRQPDLTGALGAGYAGVMPLTAASCFGFTSSARLL